MKKLIAFVLLVATILSLSACGKTEEPSDTLEVIGPETSAPAVSATPAPALSASIDVEATPTPDPNATPTPSPTPKATVNPESTEKLSKDMPKNIDAATKINSDVYGWIKVPNTNIDYPILYGKDWYYNTHDIFKKKSDNGSIYSYYKQLTRNSIITGHNMRKAGLMLHELHKLQDNKDTLKDKKNRTFTVDWFGLSKWEVFALYETTDSEPKSTLAENTHHLSDKSPAEIQAWIDKQKNRSEIDLGVSVSPDDFLMTILTCGDNYDNSDAQSRLYYFLKCTDAPKKN